MNTKYFFFLLLTLIFFNGCSATPEIVSDANDGDYLSDINDDSSAPQVDDEVILKSTINALHSTPPINQASIDQQINDYITHDSVNNNVVPNDVWKHLPDLYQLPDINNERIESQKKWFLKHKRHLSISSKRASPFLFFIVEEINKRNMPGELALLPIIESSFNPNAQSAMKAAGLWQFMPATGRSFGLNQNWWYDGRLDVYHSTLAALTYLEQLNKYYKGDWLLALAAYNAGAGNVNKAIKYNLKQGKAIDYWSLSLPKETYKYIPKLLALSKIIAHQQALKIPLEPIKNSPYLMMVNTQSQISLSVVAEMADISVADIRTYNPAFKRWATAPDGPHHLFIPIKKAQSFETQLATLDDKDRIKWYRHKIRSGENLGVIAQQYKISVKALKNANNLKNSRIRAGKYLMVPSGGQQAMTARPVASSSAQSKRNNALYEVRKGDSFWTIAKKFNMSHRKLASINHLSSGDTLSIGQKLLISSNNANQQKNTAIMPKDVNKDVINYRVKSGDSLYTISRQFKVSINDLKRWNQLDIKKYLKPGQKLKVLIVASK